MDISLSIGKAVFFVEDEDASEAERAPAKDTKGSSVFHLFIMIIFIFIFSKSGGGHQLLLEVLIVHV